MKIRSTFASAAVALALTLPAGFAFQDATPGQTEEHGRWGRRAHGLAGHLFGRAAAELNLTDQQKEFARQLMAETRNQAQPVLTQLKQNRTEMTEAIKANNISAIDSISQRQGTLAAQLGAVHAKARAALYAQLTPEQKTKADEFRARLQDRANRWTNR